MSQSKSNNSGKEKGSSWYNAAAGIWKRTKEYITYNQDHQSTAEGQSGSSNKAVQIFSPKPEGNGYKLDRAELERIFSHPDVKDKPVAIYSLAGAFRKGKSFMLNLFLRFLQSGRSEDWLSNKREEIYQGFVSRGGHKRCTEGIWIWNEPFCIDSEYGEVVVFLMDTQGTFDQKTKAQNNLLIFVLSTLISSVQIFNIKDQIQNNDLEFLQLFTEYGKLVAAQNSNFKEKSFQHLMFLIRDWSNPDFSGIEGGRRILNEILMDNQNDEARSMCETITSSFELVECCLLPKPGNTVEVRRENDPPIKLEDVSPEFLEEVQKLAKLLFGKNIRAKRVEDKLMTGTDLINVILAYNEIFESGTMPAVETIMEASSKAAIQTTIWTCKDMYIKRMNELCGSHYMKPQLLIECHENCKQETLKYFDELPKLGKPEFISQHRQQLIDITGWNFSIFQQNNLVFKEQIKEEIRSYISTAEEEYISKLRKKSKWSYVNESRLKCIEKESKKEVLTVYENSTADLDDEIVQAMEKTLNERLLHVFQRFVEANKQKKMKLDRIFSEVSVDAIKKYRNKMDEKCDKKYLEEPRFTTAEKKCREIALDLFDSSKIEADDEMKYEKRTKLVDELNQLKLKYEDENKQNKKRDEEKMDQMVLQAKEYYRVLMSKNCDSYHPLGYLNREHEKCKKEAAEINTSVEREKGNKFADKFRARLEKDFKVVFKKIMEKNEVYKELDEAKMHETIQKANQSYRHLMLQSCGTSYKPTDYIDREHEKCKKKAAEIIISVEAEKGKEFADKCRTQVEDDLKDAVEIFKSKNKECLSGLNTEFSELIDRSITIYKNAMKKECKSKFVEWPDFRNIHQQSYEGALQNFSSTKIEADSAMIGSKTLNLKTEISRLRSEYKEKNELNERENINVLKKNSEKAYESYKQIMDKNKEHYVIENELEEFHQRAQSQADTEYKASGTRKPADEYKNIKKTLQQDISTYYELAKQRNEDNKKIERGSAELHLQQLKAKYLAFMKKFCDKRFVKPKILEYVHNKVVEKVKENFKQKTGVKFSDMSEKLNEDLKNLFDDVKAGNNPGILRRIIDTLFKSPKWHDRVVGIMNRIANLFSSPLPNEFKEVERFAEELAQNN